MPVIRQLSRSVVNKIAAGEVIERPASVVKELVENAVDAGAARIDVALEQGGAALVRVVDDGCGIAADQLVLAVATHATSKIVDADDLFRVTTLGFRGEALASIAEVSQLALKSRTAQDEAAAEIDVVAGELRGPTPRGAPVGTQIEVRNLFFNTPVRRKFLKSTQTEAGHAVEAFTRIALAHPGVHFTLRHNDRALFDLPAVTDVRQRVGALFGERLAESLIDIDRTEGDVRLWGYVADPSESRGNNRMQYLFLNGRYIRDRSLQHALTESYRGLLLTGRYPIGFLNLSMPPEDVDVNVHPTKLEVRFQDGGRLYSQLLGALRSRFLSTDLTARGNAARGGASGAGVGTAMQSDSTAPLPLDSAPADYEFFDSTAAAARQAELVAWAKGRLAAVSGTAVADAPPDGHNESFTSAPHSEVPSESPSPRFDISAFLRPHTPLEVQRLDTPVSSEPFPDDELEPPGLEDFDVRGDDSTSGRPSSPSSFAPSALQIHNRYIVTESPEGVVVIDQHALHERILYEQLRSKVLAGALESQQLLVPEPVELSPADAAAVLDRADLLSELGIRVSHFGGGTVLVSSYPAMLANLSPADLLAGLIDKIVAGGQIERRDLVDELLHMIACKAAIKAGDHLSPGEIESLLAARHLAQDAHHCPHGRPTSLVFTKEELDRQFKRT